MKTIQFWEASAEAADQLSDILRVWIIDGLGAEEVYSPYATVNS